MDHATSLVASISTARCWQVLPVPARVQGAQQHQKLHAAHHLLALGRSRARQVIRVLRTATNSNQATTTTTTTNNPPPEASRGMSVSLRALQKRHIFRLYIQKI
jgi:hypothetical protein